MAYNPPYIKIYGYKVTEEQRQAMETVCRRRSSKGKISDWFRLIATSACIWIWRHDKIPDVIYVDLTKKQRDKIKKLTKERKDLTENDCISDILKNCIDNL